MFNVKTAVSDYMTMVVTHECDRKCPFCIDEYRGRAEFITLDNVIKGLEFAKINSIKDILIVGGEPTLHPEILEIAKLVKRYGFKCILTTNYNFPEVVKALDGIVDSFNISFYDQEALPRQSEYVSDLTLSVLLFEGRFKGVEDFDAFIDKHEENFALKFSTMFICNEWTSRRQKVQFLDELKPVKYCILFNEMLGQIYRGHVIKRYDRVVNGSAEQSCKCHVDGEISKSWRRANR
jgi:organic radical activating enzyme